MPSKGDINTRFGIYQSTCCGSQIAIPANVTFPGCAEHIHPDTRWKLVTGLDTVQHISELIQGGKSNIASQGHRE